MYTFSVAYVQNVLNLSWHVDSKKNYPINYNDNLQKGLSDMDLINRTWNRCDGDYPMFRGMGNTIESVAVKRYIH